jgi:hypothetical protein
LPNIGNQQPNTYGGLLVPAVGCWWGQYYKTKFAMTKITKTMFFRQHEEFSKFCNLTVGSVEVDIETYHRKYLTWMEFGRNKF